MLDVVKEQIKGLVDIEMLLDYLGVKNFFFSRNETRFPCPIHGGSKPNCSWSTKGGGVFTCWSRHCAEDMGVPRDAFLLVQLVKKISFEEALKELAGLVGVKVDGKFEFDKEKYDEYEIKKWLRHKRKQDRTENPHLDEEILKSFQIKTHPYIKSRNFPDAIIKEFEIGYSDGWDLEKPQHHGNRDFPGRVIVPVRDSDGYLVGFSGRLATDDKNLIQKYSKYKNMLDFSKGTVLYGLDKAKDMIPYSNYPLPNSLIIVEGFFDVIRPYSHGLVNVAACLGTSLLPAQIDLIVQHTSTVVLAFDSDEPGQIATERVHNQLRPFCDMYKLELPKKDLGELDFDELWDIISKPKRI